MPHPVDIHVGKKVREARNLEGLSQEELGKKLGISFQQVQKYEKGSNRIGSSRLYEISRALETPIEYFFDGIEDDKPQGRPISRRALSIAKKLEEIPNTNLKKQIEGLVKVCSSDEAL